MKRVKRWLGVAVGFVTLFFISSYRNLKKDNEKLKNDLAGAHENIKINQDGVKEVDKIKRNNHIDDRNVIDRLRDKKYLRDDD